jgi:Tol biopolymer transport system component
MTVLSAAYLIHDRRKSNRTIEMARIQITRVTDSGAVGVVALSPNGRYVCYSMREHDGWGLWLSQPAVGAASRILPADALGFEGITFSPDGNYIYYVRADKNDPGFKYLYSMPVLGGPPRILVRDIDSPVSFSPDGQKFVYTRGMPTSNTIELRIANANGNANYLLATFPNTHGFQPGPTWSPDGRTIAVVIYHDQGQSYGLNTVSVADGLAREIYTNTRPIGRPHWLPEGDELFLVLQGDNDHGQLWTISYPAAVLRRISNDLTDYSVRSDLTYDAKNMASIAQHTSANIWVAPSEHLDQAKQVTSTALPLFQINDSPGGHLIADDQSGKLWTLSADGTQRSGFSDAEKTNAPTPCGRYMVFTATRTDAVDLMRTDSDGNNPRRLATGHLASWTCACGSDGNEVFYMDLQSPHSIQRTPIEGGTPVKVADVLGEYMVGRMSISPDGRFLAYPFEVYKPDPVLKLAIIPTRGAGISRVLTAPGGAYSVSLLWSRDGKGLQYILTQEGAANIWQQRLDGSGPVRLTNFTTGRIFDFHWSLDGKRLLLARGEISSDAVLLSNIR